MDALFLVVNNPTGSGSSGEAVGYFVFQWIILLGGATVHFLLDRKPKRRTGSRAVELYLFWIVVGGGLWAILGGIMHITGNVNEIAASIGYAPSKFQWEVGWGDIAIGVLGFMSIWRRDGWLTAAVVALAISYGGDAWGHIVEWQAHSNDAPDNVWAIPSDIVQPLLAIILLVKYRRNQAADSTSPKPAQ